MIFDEEDVTVLNRIVLRKGCETAMASIDPSIDDRRRGVLVDGLARQILRARIMSYIGRNEVADLDSEIPLLEENMGFLPSELLAEYYSGLSERDSEDEAHFAWLTGQLMRHMPLLKEALRVAGLDCCGLVASDERLILAVRPSMAKAAARCGGMDPEVLGGAAEYASAVDGMCSALLRIRLLKAVTSEELSEAVLALDRASEEDFDAVLLPTLDPAERFRLESFRQNTGRYVSAVYARCILNSRMPEMASVSDLPE